MEATYYRYQYLFGYSSVEVGVESFDPSLYHMFSNWVLNKKTLRSTRKCMNVWRIKKKMINTFKRVIDSGLNKLTPLKEYISDIEGFINIQLDNVQNQLI